MRINDTLRSNIALQAATRNTQNLSFEFEDAGSVALQPDKLRVAAYCRVSTITEMQENSMENQTVHYTNHIRSNPEWRLVGIYTDRGTTGTKTVGRAGFQRMIRHALDGKIDLILCKSISRFARNVMDTLDTVRMLNEHGVRVIFEKENIDTDTMQSEFILTMLAAVAQEESRSISENLNWSYRRRFERGEPVFTRLFGYRKDESNKWVIIEEEAKVVREAFSEFVKGTSTTKIANNFILKGYRTPSGTWDWSSVSVRQILKNERYTGDALCQKTYTKDHLSHQTAVNRGERNQYLVKNHHDPIVDRATFAKAQEILLANKRTVSFRKPTKYPLSGRLTCGKCGGKLHRGYGDRWRCSSRNKSKLLCSMTSVKEDIIKKAMVVAFYQKYNLWVLRKDSRFIQKIIKDLQGAISLGDGEYNQLRLELERALFEENMAVIKGARGEAVDHDLLKTKRGEIEKKLQVKEQWRELLEADHDYRVKALNELDKLSIMSKPLSKLKDLLSEIEFCRAWVVRVKALSPTLFSVTWVTGEEIEVDISKEMIEHVEGRK